MTFEINNSSVSKRVTLEQLTAGLDAVKDRKKIDRIALVFDEFNKNKVGSSEKVLDLDEQVALMNDLHRADGDGKGEDFDGKVSGKGLKKAGLKSEYKAYRDFMEAYQKAIGNKNTFELTFKDGTVDGQAFVQTTAERKGTVDGQNFVEQHKYVNNDKAKLIIKNADGTFNFDPQGRLTRRTTSDNKTIMYQSYTSDAKNAYAGRILLRDESGNTTVYKLQDDGAYINEEDNSRYSLDENGIPQKLPDEVKTEVQQDEKLSKPLKEEQKEIVKPLKPKNMKMIRLTVGWKNQHVKLNAESQEQFNQMNKAEEVLQELVNRSEAFKDVPLNKEKLLEDLIKNNPSVFNSDGIIYSDARWNRLDFPSDLSRYKT